MYRRPQHGKKLAFLALALIAHHDELLADFQQVYGMDVWDALDEALESDEPPLRLAALAYQLPPDSRVRSALHPAGSNSPELMMLRQMELNQRMWAWGHTKDGERGENEPEPIWLRGEEQEHERRVEHEENMSLMVADALGIDI